MPRTRTAHAYSVLNIYPYNNGHMLIVTNRHVDDLDKLTRVEREDLFDLYGRPNLWSSGRLSPKGIISGSTGRVAGAGFPGMCISILSRGGKAM